MNKAVAFIENEAYLMNFWMLKNEKKKCDIYMICHLKFWCSTYIVYDGKTFQAKSRNFVLYE